MLYTEHEPLTGLVESYQDAGSVCILRRAEPANTDPAQEDRRDRWIRRNGADSMLPPVGQADMSGTRNLLLPMMQSDPVSGNGNSLPSWMRPGQGSGAANLVQPRVQPVHEPGNGTVLPPWMRSVYGTGTRNLLLHSQMVEP
jgi:hypothetical protein